MRWEDDLVKWLGTTWARTARERSVWKDHGKAFGPAVDRKWLVKTN